MSLNFSEKSKMTTVIVYFEISFTFLLYFYLQIYAAFARCNEIVFIEKMMNIDGQMSKFMNLKTFYKKFQKEMEVALILSMIFFYILAAIILYFMILHNTSIGPIIIFLVYIHQSVSNVIYTIGFCSKVRLIHGFLQQIKERLKKILNIDDETSNFEIMEDHKDGSESTFFEMMNNSKFHKKICAQIEDLNNLTGFPMLLNFAHDFVLLTIQVFAVLFVINMGLHKNQSILMIIIFLWTLPNVVKIGLICGLCHWTRNEVN